MGNLLYGNKKKKKKRKKKQKKKKQNFQEAKRTLNVIKTINTFTVQATNINKDLNIWAFIGK